MKVEKTIVFRLSLDHNLLGFSVGIEICLFFERGSEMTWFLCRLKTFFFCRGRTELDFGVAASKLT